MIHRILFVDHATGLGGAEQSLLLLLKHLDRSQRQPHLACVGGPLADAALTLDVTVHQIDMPPLRRSRRSPLDWLNTTRQIARISCQIDAVLIHSNTIRSTLYAAPAAKFVRQPFVWHMRDFWLSETQPDHLWSDRWGKRLLCELSTQVIANSHAVVAQLPCADQAIVIHNGIETEWFVQEAKDGTFREVYGISSDAPLVGMIGRLRPWKGQEAFLHMAAQLHDSMPDTRFLIVGGDPFQVQDDYALRLQRITSELDLTDCVVFTGQLEDVRPALAAMDVFVHPGAPEPFGLVNIEAMAMAKPVVAYAHGALPEIVVNGETGILVQSGDESGMAAAIAQLLQNRDEIHRLGQAGRQRVLQHFDICQTVTAVQAVYDRILAS